ncbi:MAG TPA: ABC transporter family substrate-binding protein [Glycomyces sp.]|nr:ABC transporter family substrate-binding protein [Glycomyces sp.]
MHSKRHATAAAIGLTAALALSACGETVTIGSLEACADEPADCNSGEPADGGEITWALDGSWSGWNHVKAEDNNQYVSEALIPMWPAAGQFDPDGRFQYNDGVFAAEPELVSEDPLQVEYTLQDGATWGDGTPIGVDDFVYHWYATSADPDLCAGCAPAESSYGSAVESIEGEGSTVTVTYAEGHASAEWRYHEVLSAPAHVAAAEVGDWKADPETMAESQDWFSEHHPTWSAGPYRIADAEMGEYVIYEPNPEWAGETAPSLDKLTLRVIEGLDNIVTELRQGAIDGSSPGGVDPDTVGQLASLDEHSFAVASGPGWEHLDLNLENEFLADPALRTALLTAVDVENLIERTAAQSQPDVRRKGNHLFRADSEHYEDHVTKSGQGSGDVELAQGILEGAGYTWDDSGDLLTPDGEQVTLDLRYLESNGFRHTAAGLVQAYLNDLGVEVAIAPVSGADYGDVLFGGQFDMILFGWATTPTFTVGASQMFGSDSGSNFGGLDNPDVDALLTALSGTLDHDEAAEIANAIVAEVVDDAYVLPIVDSPVTTMISDNLVNVRDNWASQQRALYNVAEWGVREN